MNTKVLVISAILALLLSFFNLQSGSGLTEGFWGNVQLSTQVQAMAQTPDGRMKALNLTTPALAAMGGHAHSDFVSVPSFQSTLSPRFSNLDYGALVRYSMPAKEMQGVPMNPKGDANYSCMVSKENYVPQCGMGGTALSADPSMPVARAPVAGAASGAGGDMGGQVSELPVATMDGLVGASGEAQSNIVFDRYMFSPLKSRYYGMGDYIRGDLAIIPRNTSCDDAWFNVYPTLNVDLNAGAMNAMGGHDNETSRALAGLMNKASGGAKTTFGGVDLARAAASVPQYKTSLSQSMKNVEVVGFN